MSVSLLAVRKAGKENNSTFTIRTQTYFKTLKCQASLEVIFITVFSASDNFIPLQAVVPTANSLLCQLVARRRQVTTAHTTFDLRVIVISRGVVGDKITFNVF